MALDAFLSLLVFTFVASVTPGPNNAMLFSSGVNFGFSRTIPHMAGITSGFILLVLCVGGGLGVLIERYPALLIALKVIGGAYLLYIAYRIATTRAVPETASIEGARPMTLIEAAAFQWVNPKAWVMILGAIAAFANPENYWISIVLVAGSFLISGPPAIMAWAGFGSALRGWLADPVRLKWFNISMAALLVLSLWPMLR